MKFIKIPVVTLKLTEETVNNIFNDDMEEDENENDGYDWEGMGIEPPEGYRNNKKKKKNKGVPAKDNDFVEKVKRIRLDLISDYIDSHAKMGGHNVTEVFYANGDIAFFKGTADELDVFLQDENNYIKL